MGNLFNYKSLVPSTFEIQQLTSFINQEMQKHDFAASKNVYPIENRTLDFRPLNALNQLNTGSRITDFEFADFIFRVNDTYGADIEEQRTMQGILDALFVKVAPFYQYQFAGFSVFIFLPFIALIYAYGTQVYILSCIIIVATLLFASNEII